MGRILGENKNLHLLMIRVQSGSATLKFSMRNTQKAKNKSII